MQGTTAWHDLKQRVHEVRDDFVRQFGRAPEPAHMHRLQRLEQVLLGMEEGLYPVCDACGARIEMDRLLKDPAEKQCWSCAANAARKP